jgi:16S rRNA (cytosine1402-N4)-methyltransferase
MRTRRSTSSGDPVTRINVHRSVLLQESIDSLQIKESDVVIDATLGGAGHAAAISMKLGAQGTLIGFDLDRDAIERAREVLGESICKKIFVEANFRDLGSELAKLDIRNIDKALFDLGWSSFQLEAGRGFSFQKDEPLLMTYTKAGTGLTADIIVNTWAEGSIADVLYGWGEERYARRIAKRIVERREIRPIKTSAELADIVKGAVPAVYRYGRLHPATKTFQALRIAVNDELGALKEGISAAWDRLNLSGRIAVISFHSIEDREVKRLFAELAKHGGKLIVKKPIQATKEELIANPRARSAKLRIIEKLS